MTWFWCGLIVEKSGDVDPNVMLVRVVDVVDKTRMVAVGCEYAVPKSQLYGRISEAFKIGDKVRSNRSHNMDNFEGVVTGFELETNRAICLSTKISRYKNDRTRYAYLAKEIVRINEDLITFKVGHVYEVNNEMVKANATDNPARVILNKPNGEYVANVPVSTTYDALEKSGLSVL